MNTLRNRAARARNAVSSWNAFNQALLVEPSKGFASEGKGGFSWSNAHMDPTPKEERTWRWWNFGGLWFAYGFSPGVWALGSSMIKAGLTPGQAIACVFIAHLFGAIMIVFNSRFGAVYHMGFPVYARISFGLWGSFFPVLLRCALGILWVGVLVYQGGGYFLDIVLRCIFGHRWMDIENTLPASAGTNSRRLLAAMIFWIMTVPATYLPMHKTRHFWTVKVLVLPPCVIGLFIYTQVMSGTPSGDAFPSIKRIHGSELSWVMLAMINSAMGKTSSLQANQPDLARYAYNKNAPALSQLIALPLYNTCVSCFGIFATSSVYKHWGVAYWNSWDLLNAILDNNWDAGARCAVALCALGWSLSCFVSNIAANVMPFGANVSTLFPRIMDINRGQLLAYCIGIIIQPARSPWALSFFLCTSDYPIHLQWYILATADMFLTFLAGYSIFFGPIAGISAVDYFFSRRGNVDVMSCYDGTKKGLYMYTYGFNWRAFLAYVCGLAPTLPGFAGTLGHQVPAGAKHIFSFGWLFSIVTSSTVYFIITYFFRHRNMHEPRQERFEKWADDQVALLDRTSPATDAADKSTDSEDKDPEASAEVLPVREV